MKRSEFQQVVVATMSYVRSNFNAGAHPNKEIWESVEKNYLGSLQIEEDMKPRNSKSLGLHKRTDYSR